MGLADDMRKLSETSGNNINDKEFTFRINQLHKMIEEQAKRGQTKIRVSKNFFVAPGGTCTADAIGEKVSEQLMSEGFSVASPVSNILNGDMSGDWTIYWHNQNEEE